VGQWAMTQMQQKQVRFEAENKLLIGLIQAAQTHTNQSLL
jgi:putative aminopeptidase FrvX